MCILKVHEANFAVSEARPFSSVTLVRLPSISVALPDEAFDKADALILEKTGQSFSSHSGLWVVTEVFLHF